MEMDSSKDGNRRKDRRDEDDDRRREKKAKRPRSLSPPQRREGDRKRRHSRSPDVKQERNAPKDAPPPRKAKETDMLNTRTGGAYIPPARLRLMQAQITDKSSPAYQRLAWEALKKSIHGHINKINVGNIGIIIKELLKENIVRGRGLLCRSVIQAQAASPTFTNVYAALVAAVNSRFPNIGELLLKRLVIQFKRGFKRNDKPICISSASFIAHLVNQRVAHEILALELLTLLVETPTDDSVEVAIAFLKECGQKLTEVSSKGVNAIFEMLRNILHEGQLDKRVQYMIEVMFQVWKDGFKDHPALIEELELVPEEEQFTHLLMLDDATDPQDILNVFKFDEKYEDNETKYKNLSKEILGSDAESGDEDGSEESGSEESDDENQEEQKGVTIIDNTETNLIALRRTIYLTINSSLDFEECAHKLMKMQLKPGQEVELCHMFLDCCAEQRTYEKFYGLLAQRFCNINRIYIGPFEDIFKDSYSTAHRLDTNRLRNVSKFFAHLLFTDSISWEVLECVKLNEEDTTSSSRIYIKILFQELAEYMGLKKLNDRLKDPTLQTAFLGVFPRDNPKNTRFSINFFTSIGLGGLTDELREHLKQMPKNVPPPAEITLASDSSDSSSSSSSSDSSDSSSSDSEEEKEVSTKKKKDKNKEKAPQTPEDDSNKNKAERWGHDGFYDTYGKDARRHEPNERDKDNFLKPRDVPRRNQDSIRRNDERNRRDRNDDKNGSRGDDDDARSRRYRNETQGRDDRRDRDGDDRRERDGRRSRDDIREKDDTREKSDRGVIDDRRDRDDKRERDDRRDREDRRDRGNMKNRDDIRGRDHMRERDDMRDRGDKRERDDRRFIDDRTERDDRGERDDRRDRDDKRERGDRKDRDDVRERDDRRDRDEYRKDKNEYERDSGYESKSKRYDDERRDREKKRDEDRSRSRYDDEDDRRKESRDLEKDDSDNEKKKKKKDKKSKQKPEDSNESSDEDNQKKKEKRKKSKKKSKKVDDDGWDIRGSSIRKEIQDRFWDDSKFENNRRETVERSPESNRRR